MSEQIGSTRPLAPNWLTSSPTRTPGSAKLVSGAVHECAITGHGQVAAPHEVSAVLGAFQFTVYGVAGPVMAATMTWLGSGLSALIRLAVSTTLSR